MMRVGFQWVGQILVFDTEQERSRFAAKASKRGYFPVREGQFQLKNGSMLPSLEIKKPVKGRKSGW